MFLKKNKNKKEKKKNVVKVKRASDIIKNNSHKQKKYLSLMLVPSYTTGKTRSLRIPRSLFYFVLISLFAVSSVIAGLQIRAEHMRRLAEGFSTQLDEVVTRFDDFKAESEEQMEEWISKYVDANDTAAADRVRAHFNETNIMREHQSTLDDMQNYLNELENMIHDMDGKLVAAIEGLSVRSFIPPVAKLLEELHISQSEIRAAFSAVAFTIPVYENGYYTGEGVITTQTEGFVPLGASALTLPPPVSREDLRTQITEMKHTIEMLNQLKESFQTYRVLIQPHDESFPTLWPVRGHVSSNFGGRRCPFGSGAWQHHTGIDIPAPTGADIRATGGGTVIFSGWMSGGWGNKVIIDHGNNIRTVYAHNRTNLVTVGQRVERGEVIARVGSSGQTTGPHVHYEVHVNGVAVNPRDFLLE